MLTGATHGGVANFIPNIAASGGQLNTLKKLFDSAMFALQWKQNKVGFLYFETPS